MKQKQLRKLGFTQKKPVKAGMYFIGVDSNMMRPEYRPTRIWEGWDIACIYFKNNWAGRCDSGTEDGCWYMERQSVSHAWKKGMWIKGPIGPDWQPPTGKEPQ